MHHIIPGDWFSGCIKHSSWSCYWTWLTRPRKFFLFRFLIYLTNSVHDGTWSIQSCYLRQFSGYNSTLFLKFGFAFLLCKAEMDVSLEYYIPPCLWIIAIIIQTFQRFGVEHSKPRITPLNDFCPCCRLTRVVERLRYRSVLFLVVGIKGFRGLYENTVLIKWIGH